MCGIHGIITRAPYAHNADDFIRDSFLANQVRGLHSSGIFQLSTTGDLKMFKKAVNGSTFIEESEARGMITAAPRSLLTVGHVRHATFGAKDKDENAHPFEVVREDGTKIIGVHNGSLRGWKDKKDSADVDVDSAWAFQMIAAEGIEAFKYFNGAYCFVWYDTAEPEVLNVARNNERPFHMMGNKEGNSLLFASELGMLGWLAERNKFEAKPFKGQTASFLFATPGIWFKLNMKQLGQWEQLDLPAYDPKTTIVKPYTSLHPYTREQHYSQGHPHARQRDYYRDWYGDDGDWGDGYGDAMPWRQGFGSSGMEGVLDDVKAALKKARDNRNGPSQPELAQLEEAIRESIAEREAEKEVKSDKLRDFLGYKLISPPDLNATTDEREAAKAKGYYGRVAEFDGIMYDDETGELMGEVRTVVDNETHRFEGVLRGITAKAASKNYIHSTQDKPAVLVVIGWRYAEGSNPYPYAILAEMTDVHKELVMVKPKIAVAH